MADDLDDEWWLQEKVASSGEDSSEDSNEQQKGQKRKEVEEAENEGGESEPKKKKKRKKKMNITEALEKHKPTAGCPGDLVKAIAKHFEGKLTPVEEDEIQLTDDHFLTCNSLDQSATNYLELIMPKWKKQIQKLEKPGAPRLLIINSAALRSTEMKRSIKTFLGEKCKTAKLFAKHMKVKEQEKHLEKNVIHCGIGTPNRIKALLDSGALKTSHLHYIIFDWNWRDQKQRRLIDIPEIRTDLTQLLQKHLVPLVKSGSAKFGLL